MTVRNERFTSFIDEFTSSTYIMVIVSGPDIEEKLISVNIKSARDYFEKIIKSWKKTYIYLSLISINIFKYNQFFHLNMWFVICILLFIICLILLTPSLHFITTSVYFIPTTSAVLTNTFSTSPSAFALTRYSIFMDSTEMSVSPTVTFWPGVQKTLVTVPGIGDTILAAAAVAAAPDSSSSVTN